jgi:HAD superfamily hydrolase (TIGR01459 family)
MSSASSKLSGLSALAPDYDVILSDIWGVLHNGIAAFPTAVEALQQCREAGLKVVLISNAPRPSMQVREQLVRLGVPEDAYHEVITSGDVTRTMLVSRYDGCKVTHIGPDKDRPLVAGLPIDFTDDADAEVCLCSGLIDDRNEGPDDYRDRLSALVERNIPMICANPDKVVELGDTLIYCAGALADIYEEMGGEVIILGKPHAPIYEAARQLAGEPSLNRVLGLGDSMRTDLRGASEQGFDCLFLTGGIHAAQFGPSLAPNPKRVEAFLADAPYPAKGWMVRLGW